MEKAPNNESIERIKFPTIHINNRVLWLAKPELLEAFPTLDLKDLDLGDESELGLVLAINNKSEGGPKIEGHSGHGRSAVYARGDFQAHNFKYNVVDTKGIGYINEKDGGIFTDKWVATSPYTDGDYRIKGLAQKELVLRDAKYTAELQEYGVFVAPTLAIIECLELPIIIDDKQEIVPVEVLHRAADKTKDLTLNQKFNHPYLPSKYTPVIQIRAFAIKERISDLGSDNSNYNEHDVILKNVRKYYSDEFYDGREISNGELIDCITTRFAENLAIMHSKGYSHGFINPSNIPLDGSIMDCDSVKKFNFPLFSEDAKAGWPNELLSPYEMAKTDLAKDSWKTDTWGAIPSLYQLLNEIDDIDNQTNRDKDSITDLFIETYKNKCLITTNNENSEQIQKFCEEIRSALL